MSRSVRVGLQLPSFSWPGGAERIGEQLADIAARAEDAGFASLWLMDHLFQLPEETGWGGPEEPMLEAYTALGFLAHATERISLGALVGGVHFRHPGVLVKTVTTLDVLSGGRAWFGIGAGWYAREALGLGIPWPSRAERFERLEETLRIAHAMWSDGGPTPLEGRHYQLAEPLGRPRPVRQPHPPIMVGGGGERKTLRLVAQYADACNILVPDPGESRAKLDVLRRHCDDVGRAFEEIETTSLIEVDVRPGRDRADAVAAIRAQAEEGIAHVIVNMPDAHVPERMATMREVIGRVA
jgi:F420-dependent oxidoreductase-like protein